MRLATGNYYPIRKNEQSNSNDNSFKKYCKCFKHYDDVEQECSIGLLMSNNAFSRKKRNVNPQNSVDLNFIANLTIDINVTFLYKSYLKYKSK